MKHYIKHIYRLMVAAVCCFAVASCHDDTFDSFRPEGDGNGLDVSFTVNMPPLASAQLNSRGSAGDIIKDINTLHIYVYNADGTRLLAHCGKEGLDDFKYDRNGNDKRPEYPYGSDKYDGMTTAGEKTTPRATFKFKNSPFVMGETYRIYVTANVDVPASEYETEDKLKAYTVTWNEKETGANAQMLGMFASSDENVAGEAVSFESSRTYYLHAWLVRCASKVTVAFNTEQLNDNVWIYLHSAIIRNIPRQCHLGDGNTATADYGVIDRGERIMYAPEGSNYDNAAAEFTGWPTLSRGTGAYGSDHSEAAEALFFYENLQGEGKDKSQVDPEKPGGTPDGEVSWPDGVDPDGDGWRDEKPYGTYIEVEAYYRSTAKGNEGRGKIVYRFMLGMDTFKDYNSYRNHHFKLTLNFRGNANNVDWHIDYEPETDNPIYVPEPFYISYLYGENVDIPITIDGELTAGTKIIAEIVENNWKPKDAASSVYWNGPVQSGAKVPYDGPWHGFLSLRPTNSNHNPVSGKDNVTNADAIGRETSLKGIADNTKAYLMSYWYGGLENMSTITDASPDNFYTSAEIDANEGMHVPMQGYREFDTGNRQGRTEDTSEADNHDSYEIVETTNGGKTKTHIYLPLYTRSLFMVKGLGYSGANPFFQYQRKAVVKITCWVDKTDENNVTRSVKYSKLCDVIQVRRIINPCGIYREAGNNKSFTVNLCFRTSEKATSFMPFASEGKWSAEIESGDPGFITLNGMQKVQGRTGEYVKFQVHFIPTAAKKNRYAVILVKYHDYTCKHRILVRQGYDPDYILDVEGAVKWHCFNLRGGEREAESPLEAGSQFRWGNIDFAIDARYNKAEQFGVNPGDSKFAVVGKDGKHAGDVRWWVAGQPGKSATTPNLAFDACPDLADPGITFHQYFTLKDDKGDISNKGKKTRLPKYHEWQRVRDNSHVLYTFGVCYDGHSTSTSMTADKAFNYLYSSDDKEGSGMRGAFIYNNRDGRNLFLPVGASGYGRRKSGRSAFVDQPGTLRYANRAVYMPTGLVDRMPMFWNIKDNLGAIYWGYPDAEERKDIWNSASLHGFTAWDINVSTYDFNQFGDNAYAGININQNEAGLLHNGTYYFSDSAFLRLVDED